MKQLLLTVAVLCLSAPAFAADPGPVTSEPLPPLPGANTLVTGDGPNETIATSAEKQDNKKTVSVTATGAEDKATPEEQANMVCQGYETMGRVTGPNYVPGVDAYGKPVTPADVSTTSAFDVPERIDVPVEINVAQSMHLPGSPTEMNVVPGTVSILKDGRVLYNNHDVSSQVSDYCATKPQLNTTVKTQ